MEPLTSRQRLVLALAAGGLIAACLPLGYWWIKGLAWDVRLDVPAPVFCLGVAALIAAVVVHRVLKIRR